MNEIARREKWLVFVFLEVNISVFAAWRVELRGGGTSISPFCPFVRFQQLELYLEDLLNCVNTSQISLKWTGWGNPEPGDSLRAELRGHNL